jgi:hypothetical protein
METLTSIRRSIEKFPTGKDAHHKCGHCGQAQHVYLFPYRDRGRGVRDFDVCLPCKSAQGNDE